MPSTPRTSLRRGRCATFWRERRPHADAGLHGERHGRLLADLGQLFALLGRERAGECHAPVDAPCAFLVLPERQAHAHRADFPALTLGVHAERDRSAGAQACEQILEGHRPGVRAAAHRPLVDEHLVASATHALPVVGIGGGAEHAAFRDDPRAFHLHPLTRRTSLPRRWRPSLTRWASAALASGYSVISGSGTMPFVTSSATRSRCGRSRSTLGRSD